MRFKNQCFLPKDARSRRFKARPFTGDAMDDGKNGAGCAILLENFAISLYRCEKSQPEGPQGPLAVSLR